MKWKANCAAKEPLLLPGKLRLRSRPSGNSRLRFKKPKILKIGRHIIVPLVGLLSFLRKKRRTISIPLSSSPCRPAITNKVGPSSLARSTKTGTWMGVRVCKCATSKFSWTALPGTISCPRIVIFLYSTFLALDISFYIRNNFTSNIILGGLFYSF